MTESDIFAEQALVGSVLIDPRVLRVAAKWVRPEDLLLTANRELYQAALYLDRQSAQLDPVTILQRVQQTGGTAKREYLLQLMDITPTASNVEEYAKMVQQASRKRQLSEVLQRHMDSLGAGQADEVLSNLVVELGKLQEGRMSSGLVTPLQSIQRFLELRDAIDSGLTSGHTKTGYRDLDRLLGGGMMAGGMYTLAARPGMGKTTLALNIADKVAKTQGGVLFISLEMTLNQLSAKRISVLTGVQYQKLLTKTLDDEEYERVAKATEEMNSLPVYANELEQLTVPNILALALGVPNLALVVIDYLGIVSPDKSNKNSSRYEYTTEISGDIKRMAKKLNVPVLALAQLNRSNEQSRDKHPQLFNLRDTGAIEQDSDGVIFLYREEYYSDEEDEWSPDDLEVILAKHRHGPTGKCNLAFYKRTGKIASVSKTPSQRWAESEEFQEALEKDKRK